MGMCDVSLTDVAVMHASKHFVCPRGLPSHLGTIELDSSLRIRKADQLAGLVVGLPSATLLRRPLHQFLHIDKRISWSELMQVKARRGGLKTDGLSRGVITKQLSFEGLHPDGGTTKLNMQGVVLTEGLGGHTRIMAVLHFDQNFTGAKVNLFVALGLESSSTDVFSHLGSQEDSSSEDDPDDGHLQGPASLGNKLLKASSALLEHDDGEDDAIQQAKEVSVFFCPGRGMVIKSIMMHSVIRDRAICLKHVLRYPN